jgi:hypothetical protein
MLSKGFSKVDKKYLEKYFAIKCNSEQLIKMIVKYLSFGQCVQSLYSSIIPVGLGGAVGVFWSDLYLTIRETKTILELYRGNKQDLNN